MDPFSGIAILGAKYGVKKIGRAILGEGAEVELAEGLVGLMAAAEQSQARLAEIEKRLDVLVEQRYRVAVGMGLRYLRQAMLADRSPQHRRDDLTRAETHLVEASEASVTPLQRALCERMLVIVRFARRDRSAAVDSQTRFDLALGEAAHQTSTLLRPIAVLRNARYYRWVTGTEPTTGQAVKEVLDRARGVERARNTLWKNAHAELTAVGNLFADAAMFATMLDLPSPTRTPEPRPGETEHQEVLLEVTAAAGEPVMLGGVTCRIDQVTVAGRQTWAVRVHLSPRRHEAVPATWYATKAHSDEYSFLSGAEQEVRPGATAQIGLDEFRRNNPPEGDWPNEIRVEVSGIGFIARRGR